MLCLKPGYQRWRPYHHFCMGRCGGQRSLRLHSSHCSEGWRCALHRPTSLTTFSSRAHCLSAHRFRHRGSNLSRFPSPPLMLVLTKMSASTPSTASRPTTSGCALTPVLSGLEGLLVAHLLTTMRMPPIPLAKVRPQRGDF